MNDDYYKVRRLEIDLEYKRGQVHGLEKALAEAKAEIARLHQGELAAKSVIDLLTKDNLSLNAHVAALESEILELRKVLKTKV